MSSGVTDGPVTHDYSLEPPDEIIAELQSSVVQSRRRGSCTRNELLAQLLAAVRLLADDASGDAQRTVHVAALAIRLRMRAT